jgi:hypothetical protein
MLRTTLLATLIAGCFPSNSSDGSFVISGDSMLPATTEVYATCAKVSGVDGIELSTVDGPILRANVDDLLGDSLDINDQGHTEHVVAAQCATLSVHVHYNGYRISTDSEVAGSLDAECVLAGGGKLSTHATFDGCL